MWKWEARKTWQWKASCRKMEKQSLPRQLGPRMSLKFWSTFTKVIKKAKLSSGKGEARAPGRVPKLTCLNGLSLVSSMRLSTMALRAAWADVGVSPFRSRGRSGTSWLRSRVWLFTLNMVWWQLSGGGHQCQLGILGLVIQTARGALMCSGCKEAS